MDLRMYKFQPIETHMQLNSKSQNLVLFDITNEFDIETIFIFEYLIKFSQKNKPYLLKSICNFSMNVLYCIYDNQQNMNHIIDINLNKYDEYINKNLMSCVIGAFKYKQFYIIFSTFSVKKYMRFDKNNETHLELIKYYFNSSDVTNYNRLFFSSDTIKYIKIGDKFKLTKYYPFLVNL